MYRVIGRKPMSGTLLSAVIGTRQSLPTDTLNIASWEQRWICRVFFPWTISPTDAYLKLGMVFFTRLNPLCILVRSGKCAALLVMSTFLSAFALKCGTLGVNIHLCPHQGSLPTSLQTRQPTVCRSNLINPPSCTHPSF